MGYDITYDYIVKVEQKIDKFDRICRTINRHLKNKTTKKEDSCKCKCKRQAGRTRQYNCVFYKKKFLYEQHFINIFAHSIPLTPL